MDVDRRAISTGEISMKQGHWFCAEILGNLREKVKRGREKNYGSNRWGCTSTLTEVTLLDTAVEGKRSRNRYWKSNEIDMHVFVWLQKQAILVHRCDRLRENAREYNNESRTFVLLPLILMKIRENLIHFSQSSCM